MGTSSESFISWMLVGGAGDGRNVARATLSSVVDKLPPITVLRDERRGWVWAWLVAAPVACVPRGMRLRSSHLRPYLKRIQESLEASELFATDLDKEERHTVRLPSPDNSLDRNRRLPVGRSQPQLEAASP